MSIKRYAIYSIDGGAPLASADNAREALEAFLALTDWPPHYKIVALVPGANATIGLVGEKHMGDRFNPRFILQDTQRVMAAQNPAMAAQVNREVEIEVKAQIVPHLPLARSAD